jgi:hypothetical protein
MMVQRNKGRDVEEKGKKNRVERFTDISTRPFLCLPLSR